MIKTAQPIRFAQKVASFLGVRTGKTSPELERRVSKELDGKMFTKFSPETAAMFEKEVMGEKRKPSELERRVNSELDGKLFTKFSPETSAMWEKEILGDKKKKKMINSLSPETVAQLESDLGPKWFTKLSPELAAQLEAEALGQ